MSDKSKFIVAKAYKEEITDFEKAVTSEIDKRVFEKIKSTRDELAASLFDGKEEEID